MNRYIPEVGGLVAAAPQVSLSAAQLICLSFGEAAVLSVVCRRTGKRVWARSPDPKQLS